MSIDVVFVKIVNMSVAAGWLILAVVLLRLLLKKAPKWISCVLWAMVAVRLVCPFSLESALSLIPSSETIPEEIFYYEGTQQHAPAWLDIVDNPVFSQEVSVSTEHPVSVVQTRFLFWTVIWLAGIIAMLAYTVISYIRLKRDTAASVRVRDNVLVCDEVQSPFILGIVKPVIYAPSSLKGETLDYVTAHERAHIQRRDHWWKPFGFFLLTVYWFNPLCWLAYILFCRDIETACDERVVRELDSSGKAAYSQALLNCSFPRKRLAACPVAFGEVGVKERVRSVLNYKKPAFWLIIAAVAVCIVTAVCFLTDPKRVDSDMSFPDDVAGYYVCEQEGFGGSFYIELKKDGTFEYYEGFLSSYIGMGKWEYDGTTVVLIDNTFEDERRTYFAVGENSLVFIKDGSDRFIYVDLADGTRFFKQSITEETEAFTEEGDSDNTSAEDYFIPDYASMNTAHADAFLESLKQNGYYTDGELDRDYNTDGITCVVNITPKSISDETPDIEIFLIKDAEHCFLMANGVIYRYETFGGYHQKLCMWDYDGNGTKDLVSYDSFGSGIPYLGVGIFDMTKMKSINVVTRNLLSEPEFSFEFKDGRIYLDGEELTYSAGVFRCKAFTE